MSRRSKRILTGLGMVLVALIVTYAILLVRATTRLRQAYAALAGDGRPMQAAEVIPPKVPDADNAALLYQSAALRLKGQAVGEKNLLERLGELGSTLFQKPTDPDKIARQQRELAELRHLMSLPVVASALSTVEQGTQRPVCQFEREYNGRLPDDMPVEKDVRNLVRVLTVQAWLEAEAGQRPKAWATVQAQLKLADAFRNDPMTMCQWMRLSLVAFTCRTIQMLCETAAPDAQTAQEIDRMLKASTDVAPFVHALDGERLLIGEWFFNLPREEMNKALRQDRFHPNDALPESFQRAMYRLAFQILAFKPRLIADHAAYLQMMGKRVQVMRGPYQPRNEVWKDGDRSAWNILAYDLTLGGGNEKWVYTTRATDVQLTRAGLALLRYQQVHGRFPETLEALGLEGLVDPYTDKPLRYRPAGDGFVVYSVGEDLQDNGGKAKPEKEEAIPPQRRKPLTYDRVWRLPAPKSRTADSN